MRPDYILEEDLLWCEDRAKELMMGGESFGDVYDKAVRERVPVILARRQEALEAARMELQAYRDRQADDRRRKREEEEETRRSVQRARATLAQRPTLTATLGDFLKRKASR